MRGDIAMSEREINQVEIFEKLVRKEVKQAKVARILNLSVRQVKRKLRKYKLDGASSLIHKHRGKTSNNKIDQRKLDEVMDILREKYFDFGPTLAHEKLVENHNLDISDEKIRQEMIVAGIWKPRKRKRADSHQLRERRACFGELVQADGSPHDWFEGRGSICNLNVMVDDATGAPTLSLSKSETTQEYFKIAEQYFLTYGLPRAVYVDKHSIFVINNPTNAEHKKPSKENEYEGLTQFGRAMKQLGIELILANTPQAKGRVERINQTFQDRLVKEMRLKNISTIKQANEFLPEYTKKFVKKFAKDPRSKVNMHRPLPPNFDLTKILCVQEKRVLSKNLTCQYHNYIFQIKTKRSAYALRKTQVIIRERYDGSITLWDSKDNQLEYTIFAQLPKQNKADSKHLNFLLDDILMRQKKSPWESDPKQLLEEDNYFYKPSGAV